MSQFKRFEDITAWQKARILNKEIYRISREGEFARDYGLRAQIRDASVSVMGNIAEGAERDGNNEFRQFLSNAKGSVGEVRSHLYSALDAEYIDQIQFDQLAEQTIRIGAMIAGLIRYLRDSEMKGPKFNKHKDETDSQDQEPATKEPAT